MPCRWCRRLHDEFPALTYDVTIKIEHLLRYATHLPTLRDTGCVLVTSAVEAVQDHVLTLLDKGHTRHDFVAGVGVVSADWPQSESHLCGLYAVDQPG